MRVRLSLVLSKLDPQTGGPIKVCPRLARKQFKSRPGWVPKDLIDSPSCMGH